MIHGPSNVNLSLILLLAQIPFYLVRKCTPMQSGLYKDLRLLRFGANRFVVLEFAVNCFHFQGNPDCSNYPEDGGSKLLRNAETILRAIIFQKTLTFIINNAVKTSKHEDVHHSEA